MNRRIVIPLLVVGVFTLAVTVAVLTYHAVRAQAPTPETPAAPESGAEVGRQAGPRIPQAGLRIKGGYTNEDLAAALGITVDELQAAQQEAFTEAVNQAVSQGIITQEMADRMLDRANGRMPMLGFRFEANGIDYDSLLADALGIDVATLEAAYGEAFEIAIDRAVANGRLTQEQADLLKGEYNLFNHEGFHSSMQSAFKAAVQQAVTDGVITQEQADQILQNHANHDFFGQGQGGFFGEPPHHGGGHHPGMRNMPGMPSMPGMPGLREEFRFNVPAKPTAEPTPAPGA